MTLLLLSTLPSRSLPTPPLLLFSSLTSNFLTAQCILFVVVVLLPPIYVQVQLPLYEPVKDDPEDFLERIVENEERP